jgi:trimeric autotransporter adhesin
MQGLSTDDITAMTTIQVEALTSTDLAALSMTQVAAFTGPQISVMSGSQISGLLAASPVVLDLDGNGVRTTAAAQGVSFDLLGNGHASKTGWASSSDGLLAIDLNHNGRIDDGRELFGNGTRLANGTRASNGFEAMAQYDSNGDGKLTAADAHFKDLVVWIDANHDGKTQAGELKSLAEVGVASLDLHGLAGTAMDHGNLLGMTSSYTTVDGATHAMADVWFAKDTSASHSKPSLGDLLAAPSVDLLPGSSGSGSHGATAATTTDHTLLDHAAHAAAMTSAALAAADEERRRHHTPLI